MVNSEELESYDPTKQRQMGIVVNNEKILGREFAFGVIEVENPKHCDFTALTEILFDSHLDDLRETKKDKFYENWRTKNLTSRRKSILVPADLKALTLVGE